MVRVANQLDALWVGWALQSDGDRLACPRVCARVFECVRRVSDE